MKISDAFDLYRNNYMFYMHQSKRILENHDYVKRSLISVLGDKSISKLTLDDVQKWATEILKDKQWNSARNDIVRLRAVLRYMSKRGEKCIEADMIPVPKRRESTRDYLVAEEVRKMIDCACCLRTKVIISLLYSSGIRLSELLSLNRDDIQDGHFQIVGKGGKTRLCFIDERTEALIEQYLATRNDNCEALLVSRLRKERMTATNVQLAVKNASRSAGITKRVTPHVLRHSFATNFITNNGNIRYLSALLGHASVSTTMIYTHVVDNELERQYLQFHTI